MSFAYNDPLFISNSDHTVGKLVAINLNGKRLKSKDLKFSPTAPFLHLVKHPLSLSLSSNNNIILSNSI